MTKEEHFAKIWNETTSNCGCFWPVLVFSLMLFLFSSCITKTKVEYRDRDVNHYITNTVHDTLIDKTTDSVYLEVFVSGDTVYRTTYKEKVRWRDRIVEKHDTCWRDSIVTEKEETVKEVTKIPKLYRWSFALSIIVIIFAVIKVIRWLRII